MEHEESVIGKRLKSVFVFTIIQDDGGLIPSGTLNDGTTLEAKVNGNCYATEEKPDFPNDLTNISIKIEDEPEQIIEYGKLIETAQLDERYWFGILEIPEAERACAILRTQ